MWLEQKDRHFFWYSVLLHCLLLIVCMVPVKQSLSLMPGVTASVPIVNAAAVSSSVVQQQVQTIQAREQAIRDAKLLRIAAAKAAQKRRIEQARLRKQQELARQKAIKEKALALASEKRLAEKKAKQQAQLDALAKQVRALQEQQHQKELQQEQQKLKQVAYNQGIVNRYRQQIAQSIGNYWIISRDVNKSLSCQFVVHLAPGGEVLNVRLLKSSGNGAFDRSAEVAIYKASPLPVPSDTMLFGPFREFSLIVSPKTVMIRSPST